ncbi:hypothetical protein IST455A_05841 [Burkholderia multivorans]|nr:hypothetical protein IST495A_00176 [Burkholderia multivorans]CAB5311044.1 hypothetical protein IST419_05851 [Burkholderia multivorans]CAB5318722.1 hypothetical protein IST424_05835 [Burkholderia multivorans]CAB5320264.1 hypothetical protein IST453_05845 [Burkholderia multivorans]CAB5320324.1 hypothetical protein IST455A_05841 [Burkholderia multivorans]
MLSTLDKEHVIVHVQRKIGDCLSAEDALAFIGKQTGKSNIHVFDRSFREWVIVAQNGVAARWNLRIPANVITHFGGS